MKHLKKIFESKDEFMDIIESIFSDYLDEDTIYIDKKGDSVLVEEKKEIKIEATKESTVVSIADEQAEFPGGASAMYKFIFNNTNYPASGREADAQGKCFLKFVVNETGEISNVEILKGVPGCRDCDNEAIRVVKSMPKWKPAKMTGRAVKCYFNLPFSFKLQ